MNIRRWLASSARLDPIRCTAAIALILLASGCRTPAPPVPPTVVAAPPLQGPPAPPPPRALEEKERRFLVSELESMWTRDASRLVDVLQDAFLSAPGSPPLTFLLAIAHAETNGRILDVSEAGAVGLAQATPVAFLTEHFQGKLFVTSDYIEGEKTYLLKKPLHDADVIASVALDDPGTGWSTALQLLERAESLQTEGIDDLDTMRPFAAPAYGSSVDDGVTSNAGRLTELRRLLDTRDTAGLLAFRDRVREEYRRLRVRQRLLWAQYQSDLAAERDRLLREHYGVDAATIKRELAYEAGEYLATTLDARFSPTRMAAFLAAHLRTKENEALALGLEGETLEAVTAALYNGGSHNVKRMRAGLLGSLPETDNYKRKVPATKERLDVVLATARAATIDRPAVAHPATASVNR